LEQLSLREQRTLVSITYLHGLGFDMSFRVQCSGNYYGPNCTTFCEPMEGLYICGCQGSIICVQSGRDPVTNCTTCFPELDPETNCTTSTSFFYDPHTNCAQHLPNIQCQPTTTFTTITTSSKCTHYTLTN
jgi:hypothetical protein